LHADLEHLSAADTEERKIKAADRAITGAEERLASGRAAVVKAEEELVAARGALEALVAVERTLGREIEDYRHNEAAAIRILESGAGGDAAERQLSKSRELLDHAETKMLENLEAQDPTKAGLTHAKDRLEAAKKATTALEGTVPAEIARARAERATALAARDAALEPLDRETKSRYLLLVERKGTAVARIRGDSCSACNIAVFQSHTSDLLRGLIVPCRGCGRWLVPEDKGKA
jgi:predicted  nucleic acid-binding Zn-ribbon protein